MSSVAGTPPAVGPRVIAPVRRKRSGRVPRWAAAAAIGTVSVAAVVASIAVASPLLAIATVFGSLLALGIIVRPAVATLVVVAVLYSNAAVIAVRFHDVPFFVAAAVPALLIPPMAAFVILERRPIVITSALPWIGIFLIVQLLSGIVSSDVPTAWDIVVTFVEEGFLLYFLVTNVVRSRETVIAIAWILVMVGGALGALTFYQDATGTYDNPYWGFAQKSDAAITVDETLGGDVAKYRLAGNIGEKNRYAQIMLMLVPLGLFLAIAERRNGYRLLALGATVFISLGVALTFSRGAAVGFALLVVIMVALGYIRPRHVLVVILGAAMLLVAVPAYGERLGALVTTSSEVSSTGIDQADGAIQSRITEGLAALLAFADHPLLGVGPGQFPAVYRQYADVVGIRVLASDRQAHNLYLGLAAELGIVGITVFLVILGVTLRDLARARQATRTLDPMLSALATGFLLSIVSYLTTGLFLHMTFVRYFWLMMALAAATAVVAMARARELSAAVEPAEPADPDEVAELTGPDGRTTGPTPLGVAPGRPG